MALKEEKKIVADGVGPVSQAAPDYLLSNTFKLAGLAGDCQSGLLLQTAVIGRFKTHKPA